MSVESQMDSSNDLPMTHIKPMQVRFASKFSLYPMSSTKSTQPIGVHLGGLVAPYFSELSTFVVQLLRYLNILEAE